MGKRVLFVLSGIGYSGAEKVLEDYIKTSKVLVESYFLFYFNGDAFQHFKSIYSNTICLNLTYNRLILAILYHTYYKIVNNFIEDIVNQNEIDIVYFNNSLEGLLGSQYINNHPDSFFHVHDMFSTFRYPPKRWKILQTLRKCNNTITVSEACKKSWKNSIQYVVYNGIAHNDVSVVDKKNQVVYIGNSSKRKGYDVCVHVAKSFEKKMIPFVMIFGDKIPDYKFPKNVVLYEKLSSIEVLKILNDSKCLFLPTRKDPFPTAILEGIVCDNIVVSHEIDGIPEMLPDKNFLSKNNSIEDYVQLIDQIISMNLTCFENRVEKQRKFASKFKPNFKADSIDKMLLQKTR